MDVFLPMFRAWHATLPDERRQMFETVLDNARKDVDSNTRQQIMRTVLELRLATDMANMLSRFDAGDVGNIMAEIKAAQDQFKADVGIKDSVYDDYDIGAILDKEVNDSGIKWRLAALNNHMRPMRPGDFGIIAARPNQGKSTFIASEVSFMAEQIAPEQNVLWLNNEGDSERMYQRAWQAALGATVSEMVTLHRANCIVPAFVKKFGRRDKIRIASIHGMDNYSVEQIIEANNAAVVVYDMIDNIKGFGSEARTDQRLEEMYKWGRETAVAMQHVGIATSQISVDGDNMMFPQMHMLKDSKTGKQGACDFQIMLGSKSADQTYAAVRWLSIPKNKLQREGRPSDPRAAIRIEVDRGRFSDIEDIPEEQEAPNEADKTSG